MTPAGFVESATNLLAGLLELGRTRFELFGTELREELARLTVTLLGGLAALLLLALAIAFGATAFILTVDEAHRFAAALGVAALFLLAAAVVAWQVRRIANAKPRAFDATLSELQRDLKAIKP
jgi:uncharacterized membrane protein YqjE